ncbi:MAG: hypothetical protein KJ667_07320 [Alphaproteobacteria bacterium]|nr:hypothetical protein [Alphaproteobacteria bacterium]
MIDNQQKSFKLKSGQGYALVDAAGFIPVDDAAFGVFHRGKRLVGQWTMSLSDTPLTLVKADASNKGELVFDYAAPGFELTRRLTMAAGQVHEHLSMRSEKQALLQLQIASGFDTARGKIVGRYREGHHLTETFAENDGVTKIRAAYSFSAATMRDPRHTSFIINAGEQRDIFATYGVAPTVLTDPTADSYDRARQGRTPRP